MKAIKIFLFLIFGCLAYVFAHGEKYTVEVGQFEKLKINGNLTVVYKNLPDSTGLAVYETDSEGADVFKFSTKGEGNLKVEPSDEKWGSKDLPVLHLYSNFLNSVESFSEQNVEIVDLAPCATFNVNQVGNGTISVENIRSNNVSAAITTGNGSIFLAGSCVNANFRMVGAGLISADQLQAENVKCRILGTGSIGCWSIDNLNVSGLGSTKIYYKGHPNIKKTGGGKLFELPDEDSVIPVGVEVPSFNPPSVRQSSDDDGEEEEDGDDEDDEEEDDDDDDSGKTVVTEDD